MFKSFFEWYFKDSIQIPSPSLDEGSKRLGKLLTILGVGGYWISIILLIILDWNETDDIDYQVLFFWNENSNYDYQVQVFIFFIFFFPVIVGWVFYRGVRFCFWVADGFSKPK